MSSQHLWAPEHPGPIWGQSGAKAGSIGHRLGDRRSGIAWGSIGVDLGISGTADLGAFWGQSGGILGAFWGHSGGILGSTWGRPGADLGPIWGRFGGNPGSISEAEPGPPQVDPVADHAPRRSRLGGPGLRLEGLPEEAVHGHGPAVPRGGGDTTATATSGRARAEPGSGPQAGPDEDRREARAGGPRAQSARCEVTVPVRPWSRGCVAVDRARRQHLRSLRRPACDGRPNFVQAQSTLAPGTPGPDDMEVAGGALAPPNMGATGATTQGLPYWRASLVSIAPPAWPNEGDLAVLELGQLRAKLVDIGPNSGADCEK